MASPDPVDVFLAELESALELPAADRGRVIREVGDHLEEDITRAVAGGATRSAATQDALARIGGPVAMARQYRRARPLTGYLAGLAAIASGFAALWLVSVVTLVLPARDPRGIPFWTFVALLFLAYAALTALAIRPGRRSPQVRAVVVIAALAAVGIGAFWVATELAMAQHFEGYVVLLGLVMAGQGTALLAHGLVGVRSRRAR